LGELDPPAFLSFIEKELHFELIPDLSNKVFIDNLVFLEIFQLEISAGDAAKALSLEIFLRYLTLELLHKGSVSRGLLSGYHVLALGNNEVEFDKRLTVLGAD